MPRLSFLLLLLPALAAAAPCDGAAARAESAWAKAAKELQKEATTNRVRADRLEAAARLDGTKDADIYAAQATHDRALGDALADAAGLADAASKAAKGDPILAMQAAVTAVAAHRDVSTRSWNKARASSEAAFGLCAPPGTAVPQPVARAQKVPDAPKTAPSADDGPATPPEVSAWTERPDGLAVADLTLGTGAVAEAGAVVTVDYAGWLQNGTRFDASYPRKAPIKVVLGAGNLIKGWEDGLVGMKVGGKRMIRIPPQLGYGDRTIGPIPGGSTLLFQVELRNVEAPRSPPAAPVALTDAEYTRTASGLMVHDFTVGAGPAPKAGDTVVVDYTGWLSNGQMFDSSMTREPFDFRVGVGEVIKGWDEAILGMRAGGHRQVRIPPALAYGSSGTGPIPPGATLIFDIRLLEVQQR